MQNAMVYPQEILIIFLFTHVLHIPCTKVANEDIGIYKYKFSFVEKHPINSLYVVVHRQMSNLDNSKSIFQIFCFLYVCKSCIDKTSLSLKCIVWFFSDIIWLLIDSNIVSIACSCGMRGLYERWKLPTTSECLRVLTNKD